MPSQLQNKLSEILVKKEQAMRTIMPAVAAITLFLFQASFLYADPTEFSTAVGTVVKFEKETLTLETTEKPHKQISLQVTGTSKFHLLSPQVRSGKTVITQRSAETTDLAPGQHIAVIYTEADKEHVLLTAVMKVIEKEKEKK